MSSKLSKLVNNSSEIYSKGCRGCKSVCDFIILKNNKLHHKCNICKKRWLTHMGKLIAKFPNTYKLCNNEIGKFILLLRKGVYAYEYINSWERLDKTSLPDDKAFYSELNLEDITDEDYIHAQKVFKYFKLKNLGEYHDLYVQSDTLLLADVFRILEINVSKYMNLILLVFYQHLD